MPIGVASDQEAQREVNMQTSLQLFLLLPAVALVACLVWLHWRALHDGAIQDVLLFLSGISILSYIFSRWDRAKLPVLGVIGASVLLGIAITVSTWIGATAPEPTPEELAAEVKRLILQEWKNSPELGKATIQSIALVHKGGGFYSGFIEANVDGHQERLALEVVLDRETIRWQIRPVANRAGSRPEGGYYPANWQSGARWKRESQNFKGGYGCGGVCHGVVENWQCGKLVAVDGRRTTGGQCAI